MSDITDRVMRADEAGGDGRGFRINNQRADTIDIKRTEAGNGDMKYSLEFSHQGKAFGRLKDLSLDDLEIAIGDKNARAAVDGMHELRLQGQNLAPHDGLSPKELDRQVEEKELRKGLDFTLPAAPHEPGVAVNLPSRAEQEFDKRNPNAIENEDILPELREKQPRPVPTSITERYSQDGQKYFDKGSEERTPAFTDRGDKLSTARHDAQVAGDMVDLAHARGWKQIELKGDEEFRRAAWIAAEAKGIQTKGYTPTEKEIEAAANRRSHLEVSESTNITRDGELPADLRERAKRDPEALKATAIHHLAHEVSQKLLKDPKFQAQFEKVVERRLSEHLKDQRLLPAVQLRKDRDKERGDEKPREVEIAR